METKFGIVGTAVTIVTGVLGWLVKHEPEIRVVSLAVSILVGLVTLAWWVRKWWRVFKESAEELEG